MPVVIEAIYPILKVQIWNTNLIWKKINAIKWQCRSTNGGERVLPDIIGIEKYNLPPTLEIPRIPVEVFESDIHR